MNQASRTVLGVIVTLSMVTCASAAPKLDTPSGLPEVTIMGVTKKEVIDTVVEHSLADGFRVLSVDDYSLVVGKDMTSVAAKMAAGSQKNWTPLFRLTYNLVDTSDGVHVFVRSEMVTNPGSNDEKVKDYTPHMLKPQQALLERFKAKLEGAEETSPTVAD
jgi:hypothetical protein